MRCFGYFLPLFKSTSSFYKEKSMVVVKDAATVICVRRAKNGNRKQRRVINSQDYSLQPGTLDSLGEFSWKFESEFEVLMGQGEVINWLRSSRDNMAIMGYPGEFKFPGGSRDPGETLEETARRELSEEFLIDVPEEAKLRQFRKTTTKVIKGKQFVMYNFIALEDENEWLRKIDVEKINQKLCDRRRRFEDSVKTGEFWKLTELSDKETISPEVRCVEWMDIGEAVHHCLTSKAVSLTPVNDFQKKEFERFSIDHRDPMYATMFTLLALEGFKTEEALRDNQVNFVSTL